MTAGAGRPDPYHLAFGAEGLDDTLFPPIAGEAEARGAPVDDPDRFVFLTSVGRLIQAIAGPPAEADAGSGEAFRQHGRLLFHAFHHWRAGRVVHELEEPAVRRLLDDTADAAAAAASPEDAALALPAPPGPAGYVRLPANLVWASPAEGLRAEPADGFFWVSVPDALHLLLALGVRPDRPGFSVVAITGAAADAATWADMDARPGAVDFATTLPGGELNRLYSIETPAELLKLAARWFRSLPAGRG